MVGILIFHISQMVFSTNLVYFNLSKPLWPIVNYLLYHLPKTEGRLVELERASFAIDAKAGGFL